MCKFKYFICSFLILIIISLNYVSSSKILGVFPTPARSHQHIFDSILIGLHEKGHELTVVTHFPETLKGYKNIKTISIEGTFNYEKYEIQTIEDIYQLSCDHIRRNQFLYQDILTHIDNTFHQENMKQIWNPTEKYDLILTEHFNTHAFEIIPYIYKTPFVAISSSAILPQFFDRFGLPENPSYIPGFISPFIDRMTLSERFINLIFYFYSKWYQYRISITNSNLVVQNYFKNRNLPRIEELINNCSLILVNTHHTINNVRPLPPNVIEIGGVHIKPPGKLDEDIEKFLNESEHGVIYFGMGSLLRTSSFSKNILNSFLEAFSEIPQRVLWKFEDSNTEIFQNHKNIKTSNWFPQRDIFAHPNLKLYIGHGGLLGISEAIYEGVPILGIPIYSDQHTNVRKLESMNTGTSLSYTNLNKDTILNAIRKTLKPKFKRNAIDLSKRFKDRPLSPLNTAIFWIEYVIRYNGAPQLQSAAVHLKWYEYYFVDVMCLLITVIVIPYIIYKLLPGKVRYLYLVALILGYTFGVNFVLSM